MKLSIKAGVIAGSLAAAVALPLAGAASASAATVPGTVSFNTHLNGHPDTTGISGGAIQPGNVWAYDNMTEKFTVTPETGPNGANYKVSIEFVGSFHGFADPRTALEGGDPANLGGPLVSDGSVKGTISYDVLATNGQLPDASALPGQGASDAHLGTEISALFHGNESIVNYGPYSFTYHKVGGADYTQVG
jgi:hypothetical protein